MITPDKIIRIQSKIEEAISKIAEEENVNIKFGSQSYNAAKYTTTMTVMTLEKKNTEVKKVSKQLAARYGFKENIIGMEFNSHGKTHKIVDIKTRNKKYPIITEANDGRMYKFHPSTVKELLGGDVVIGRNARFDDLGI